MKEIGIIDMLFSTSYPHLPSRWVQKKTFGKQRMDSMIFEGITAWMWN
jgi:hypothetical protein